MGQPVARPAMTSPVWQKGVPQSMQRPPWSRSFLAGNASWNSPQSWMRSRGLRSGGSSRLVSRNPVGLPMGPLLASDPGRVLDVELEGGHLRFLGAQARLEHLARACARGDLRVAEDQVLHELDLFRIAQPIEQHHLLVAAGGEVVVLV